ncbi:MAG TPA: helix-turn-helix domain-containing protein [Thermoanaerobaculia bacterium]|nr:helix-turn-helix domain-containing protein [Thermoanaerobaculia bacterium]
MAAKSKEEVVQEYRIESIQEATMRVIGRKGMAAATMQEIADEAGVAKGTIYLYFRDREELVEKTFESAILRLMDRVDAALDQEIGIDAKIRAVMAAHVGFFGENREFFRLYLSLRMPEGPATRQRRQKQHCQPHYRVRAEKFAKALEDAMDRGEVRRGDAYKLALFIIEGSTAIILERLNEDAPPSEEVDLDLITGLILDGIRKRS